MLRYRWDSEIGFKLEQPANQLCLRSLPGPGRCRVCIHTLAGEIAKTEFIYKVLYWHFMTSGTSGMYLLLDISIALREMLSTPQEFLPNETSPEE